MACQGAALCDDGSVSGNICSCKLHNSFGFGNTIFKLLPEIINDVFTVQFFFVIPLMNKKKSFFEYRQSIREENGETEYKFPRFVFSAANNISILYSASSMPY